jgi:hypothetical protein
MGRKMSCSSKRNKHMGSCSKTLVSSTNNLLGPWRLVFLALTSGKAEGLGKLALTGSSVRPTATRSACLPNPGASWADLAGAFAMDLAALPLPVCSFPEAIKAEGEGSGAATVAGVVGGAWVGCRARAGLSYSCTASNAARLAGAVGNGILIKARGEGRTDRL